MKALKKGAKSLRKGDSKVTAGRKIDVRKVSKRGFWIALNSLTREEIFQKIRLSPGGVLLGSYYILNLKGTEKLATLEGIL